MNLEQVRSLLQVNKPTCLKETHLSRLIRKKGAGQCVTLRHLRIDENFPGTPFLALSPSVCKDVASLPEFTPERHE